MANKIRRNDEVIIIAGKDKGKRGKVLQVISGTHVKVEGINLITKHQKPIPSMNIVGGRIQREAALDISNVAIFNASTGKGDRVGFRFSEEDSKTKIRFFKSTGEAI